MVQFKSVKPLQSPKTSPPARINANIKPCDAQLFPAILRFFSNRGVSTQSGNMLSLAGCLSER